MHAPAVSPPRAAALSKEEFQDLKLLDTSAVAGALARFPLRHDGCAEGGLVCRYPALAPMLGYAVTLKVRSAAAPGHGRSFLESGEWWAALQAVPAPRVLVLQDMDRLPGAGALVGGVQASVLRTLDCVGVVTNGAVCDVARIEPLAFQMFSGSLSVAQAEAHLVQAGAPVQIGGLEISACDLIHGDVNGVVRVPRDLATRIPATAAALRRKDAEIMAYCQADDFTVEGLRDLLAGR